MSLIRYQPVKLKRQRLTHRKQILKTGRILEILSAYIVIFFTTGCQTQCGNFVIFEKCSINEFRKEELKEYDFETFEFFAPNSWEFEKNIEGEFINYQLINENEQSIIDNNIETFVITVCEISKPYDFKAEFEKFVSEQYEIKDQLIYGIETFDDTQFNNKAGIYLSGRNQENKMQFETLAICVLKDETLYWLNCTSHSESKNDINICLGKEIISTFKTK